MVLALVVAFVTTFAFAQPRGGRSHGPAAKPKAEGGVTTSESGAPEASTPLGVWGVRPDTAPKDAGTVETRTLDGGGKVFRFGEVEIEGRLKSPQLVYFLRRVRAEFAAGDLGHRSFVREMSDTRSDPNF